eukprot:5904852-Prymnesium_polylepis.1
MPAVRAPCSARACGRGLAEPTPSRCRESSAPHAAATSAPSPPPRLASSPQPWLASSPQPPSPHASPGVSNAPASWRPTQPYGAAGAQPGSGVSHARQASGTTTARAPLVPTRRVPSPHVLNASPHAW